MITRMHDHVSQGRYAVICFITLLSLLLIPLFIEHSSGGARLPEDIRQREIKDMSLGEVAYTVPWGMYADHDGVLWLHGGYSISDSPGGTVQMKVMRTADGYKVDITRCSDFRWDTRGTSYVGGVIPIPVTSLVR